MNYFVRGQARCTGSPDPPALWRNPEVKQDDDPAAWLMTCTIITTEATDIAGRVQTGRRRAGGR
ncbi:hypothetical protein GCM10010423_29510 [Streptomyces levis]|uniref:Uncharacterized protein n=1 Tax=Streptomyces levis TaxID=285566 RepID=A0ABN3NT18_9ACTN